jgi:hypothetical protein
MHQQAGQYIPTCTFCQPNAVRRDRAAAKPRARGLRSGSADLGVRFPSRRRRGPDHIIELFKRIDMRTIDEDAVSVMQWTEAALDIVCGLVGQMDKLPTCASGLATGIERRGHERFANSPMGWAKSSRHRSISTACSSTRPHCPTRSPFPMRHRSRPAARAACRPSWCCETEPPAARHSEATWPDSARISRRQSTLWRAWREELPHAADGERTLLESHATGRCEGRQTMPADHDGGRDSMDGADADRWLTRSR